MKIIITNLQQDGATISFPKDAATIASLKARFPKTRWNPTTKVWGIPGKLAFNRATKWAAEIEEAALKTANESAKMRADAEFEGRLHEVDPAAAFQARKGEIASTSARVLGASVQYVMGKLYIADVANLARRMPGAVWLNGVWQWTAKTMADVDAIIDGANQIFALRAAAIADQKAAEAARQTQYAAVRASRYIEMVERAPRVGATIRKYGKLITIESHGKSWRADDDTSSIGGPVGCEGERVCYVYYRAATEDETAKFEAADAEAKAKAEKTQARREAIATVARSTDCPHIGAEPAGEVIWRDDKSAAVGYSTRVVLTADGGLWHVTYDGSDGAAWGEYNLGYNTRSVRLQATPELINAIRG